MSRIRVGLIAGLVAVVVTSAVNIVCRLVGLFPEALDLKYMAELIVDPANAPTTAFWVGLALHILGGALLGAVFVLLVRNPTPLKSIGFTLVVVWLGMMLVIFPLRGRGFFGQNIGLVMPVATFLLNILYGFSVGVIAQRLASSAPAL